MLDLSSRSWGIETKVTENVSIVWKNVIGIIILHVLAFYGFFLAANGQMLCSTINWAIFIALLGAFGTQIGAHRLWSHRSFKAKAPLRVLLMIMQTIALQNHLYEWCRDHRVHHKYSETDADPHNSKRGFFFSHMGWFLCKKHPEVTVKGKNIDLSDLLEDPIVRFQRKYYVVLVAFFWGFLPIYIPVYCWGETVTNSLCMSLFRHLLASHHTWTVNSVAHLYGARTYDKNIGPAENFYIVYAANGEGYHNYHHTFPWDYSASEYGWRQNFNIPTMVIDFFASIGWAYDRKVASREVIKKRIERSGDGKIPNNLRAKGFSTLIDWIYGLFLLDFFFIVIYISRAIVM